MSLDGCPADVPLILSWSRSATSLFCHLLPAPLVIHYCSCTSARTIKATRFTGRLLAGWKSQGLRQRLHVMLCIEIHTARGHRAAYNSLLRKTGLNNHSRPIARHGHPTLLLAQEMRQGERWGRGGVKGRGRSNNWEGGVGGGLTAKLGVGDLVFSMY